MCCLAVPASHTGTLQVIFLSLVPGEGETYSCLGMPDNPNPLGERHCRLQKSWCAVCMAHPGILLKTFMVTTSVLQDPGWHTGLTPQWDTHVPKAECIKSLAEVPWLGGTHRGGVFIIVSPVAQQILYMQCRFVTLLEVFKSIWLFHLSWSRWKRRQSLLASKESSDSWLQLQHIYIQPVLSCSKLLWKCGEDPEQQPNPSVAFPRSKGEKDERRACVSSWLYHSSLFNKDSLPTKKKSHFPS